MGCSSASSAGDAHGPPAQLPRDVLGGQAASQSTGSCPDPISRLVQRAAACPASLGGTHKSPAQRSPHGGCGDSPAAEGLMR